MDLTLIEQDQIQPTPSPCLLVLDDRLRPKLSGHQRFASENIARDPEPWDLSLPPLDKSMCLGISSYQSLEQEAEAEILPQLSPVDKPLISFFRFREFSPF